MDITKAKRVIIKVGSSLIVDQETGQLRMEWLDSLVQDIANLQKMGIQVLLVSSGSVALGKQSIVAKDRSLRIEEKQAAAACGQIALMHMYQGLFDKYQLKVGQVLLTIEDSDNRRRFLNAMSTMYTLLSNRVIPVINENDTLATNELRFGDNDRLAARIAQMVQADVLILLSDIDGLYTADPRSDDTAKHIAVIEQITPDIEAMAGGSMTDVGSGGMQTKLMAAEIAMGAGCHLVITNGFKNSPVTELINGAKHTLFIPEENPLSARKHWIASTLTPVGEVTIDAGAAKALQEGNSLLPAGVVEVQGNFERGDSVVVLNSDKEEIAKGLIAYSSQDAMRIIGQQSTDIATILGYEGRNELIHRNDLVVY